MPDGIVLLSGASSGIGLDVTKRLIAKGYRVLAGVRDEIAARRLEDLGARSLRLDVRDAADRECAAQLVERECSEHRLPLRALINNAGVLHTGPWETLPAAALEELFAVNLLGAVALTKALLPRLRADRGRIVLTSSISARFAAPFGGAYAATKCALEAFRDSLAVELRPFGVRVTSVLPGPIATPIWGKQAKEPAPWGPYEQARPAVTASLILSERSALPVDRASRAILRAVEAGRAPSRIVVRGRLGWGLFLLLRLPRAWREAVLARALRAGSPGEDSR